MDSISQAVLGASVAGLVAPAGFRRKALLIGAALGTLPDMDVLIDYGDAVRNFTNHRGFSHSLFVLTPLALFLWLALKRFWAPVQEAPFRWLAAIALALLTHPLLDAHTAYGTQLFWPMDVPPTMWATIFIVDPLYTLPLFIGSLLAALWPDRHWCYAALRAGVVLSTLYLGWTWVAQTTVEREARASLAAMGIQNAVIFSTPTPLNSLLWRIVVQTEAHHLEGFDSLVLAEQQIIFSQIDSATPALLAANDLPAVARLHWFAQGFLKAEIQNDELIVSDLRMGQEPQYVFRHVVARRSNSQWLQVSTRQISITFGERAIAETWQRIWKDETNGVQR